LVEYDDDDVTCHRSGAEDAIYDIMEFPLATPGSGRAR
jgi:hypothetical protein